MRKKFVKGKTKIKKQKGFVTILLILVVIILGLSLSGILSSKKFDKPTSGQTIQSNASSCCDSGDGDACKPLTGPGQTLEYNGAEYGLLKSSVRFEEGIFHLKDSGLKNADGDPIILNASEGYGGYAECGGDNDQIFGPGRTCVPIPNDQLLYVCRENCKAAVPSSEKDKLFCVTSGVAVSPKTYCYGSLDTVYDVYFRTADYPSPGVPEVISKCSIPSGQTSEPKIVFNKEDGKENLQLKTFEFTQGSSGPIPYLSPYCKPAIYLYPEKLAYVNVKVVSDKPFTYTDPLYPEGGWSVLADPSGIINYQNMLHDYLYYETQVADYSVDKPREGYVVTKDELTELFSDLLPKLGLNKKEENQFSEYWINALPASPYYFVGVVAQKNLDELTSLVIKPSPTTIIRVTLYFEAIKQKVDAAEPTIVTPKRSGFTVVEWGGIYKRDKDTKFSCFQ